MSVIENGGGGIESRSFKFVADHTNLVQHMVVSGKSTSVRDLKPEEGIKRPRERKHNKGNV